MAATRPVPSTPSSEPMALVASCAFGLEAIVARELNALGLVGKPTDPGQVEFTGGWEAVCQANLWLRCADRVSIVIASFPCSDFDALFETTKSIDWIRWFPTDASIHVTGGSVKSQLTSVPAVQRTVKKAIVDQVMSSHGLQALPEDGEKYRIHIGLRNDVARLTLDTTGASLHKRGYREIATKAPLKETMAAALVKLSFWKPGRPLIDPFCGGGTILIEAAMIGRNLAPGLRRTFAAEKWPTPGNDVWQATRDDALSKCEADFDERLIGTDIHAGAISLAMKNAIDAGVENCIHFQQKPFSALSSKRQHGCVIANPPYGERLDIHEMRELYESMPLVLRNLPTWSHFILTAYPNFEGTIGRKADRRRKLYNGRIECTYYQFHGPSPNRPHVEHVEYVEHDEQVVETDATEQSDAPKAGGHTRKPMSPPVFGGITEKATEQAEIFANRLRKRAHHLRRWPTKRGITSYRVYERDIPEIPLVIDRYEDHLHVVEFERPHDRDLAQHADWLQLMVRTACDALEVDQDKAFLKTRQRQRGSQQHEKVGTVQREVIVQEGGLQFIVNLSDYTDTGLFLDHRIARGMIRDRSAGKRVLNLFAYTGAFSVYAAAGGASETTTVDWSATYLDWAKRNFSQNSLSGSQYRFVREDATSFVANLPDEPLLDLIIVDPPTFSNSKRTEATWDVQRDHAGLLKQLLSRLNPDGVIFFSCNFRRFKLAEEEFEGIRIREISRQTVPEDFRNKRIHRSWLISNG